MILLVGLFAALMIIGTPVGVALLGSSVCYFVVHGYSIQQAFQAFTSAISNSFTLIAVPFFILAANIMNNGGITRKIFNFCNAVVGWIPGGLGHANILSSVVFAGMSGAAIADAGGLGAIELQAMKEQGYDEDFSLAITGASSILGPIIPPSVPAILFGVAGSVSIGKLFMGGIIPGILMAVSMGILVSIQSIRRHYPRAPFPTLKSLWHYFSQAFFSLMCPVIIIGCIMTGVCTPTEAAIIAVFYAFLLTIFTKAIRLKDIPGFLLETAGSTVNVMFIIGAANVFAWILTVEQIPQKMSIWMTDHIHEKIIALLFINLLLLIVGTFMEAAAAISILVPILMPIALGYGIDPVHFGIMCILNLMLGLLTPPIGMVLYVLSSVSKVPFEKIVRAVLPYLVILLIVLMMITFIPEIVTFLPDLVANMKKV